MPWEISPDETPATRPTGWWVSPDENQQNQGISWDDEKHWELDLLLTLNFVNPLDLLKIATLSQPNPFAFTAGALAEMIKIAPLDLSRPISFSATPGLGFNYAGLPALTTYTTVGAYSYTIPRNCNAVDVIMIGGGKGGQGATGSNIVGSDGQGGLAGSWYSATWTRGVEIPWAATVITGSIGAGGTYGDYNGGAGGNGGNTTASVSGGSSATANGATAQTGTSGGTASNGQSAGTQSFNGQNYVGGAGGTASTNNPGNAAGAPGGGGPGGYRWAFGNYRGGPGGRGQAWFYAHS